MALINGAPPSDPFIDLNVRPWQIDDDSHEVYLEPVSAPYVGMPRVMREDLDLYADIGDWGLNGHLPMTWWAGDGHGSIARTSWEEPVIRASAWIEDPDRPGHRVWMIADGAPDGDRVRLLRSTVAISPTLRDAVALPGGLEALRWAQSRIENPGPYFFAPSHVREQGLLEPWTDRPDQARDIFASARQLAALEDPRNYPAQLERLLEPFRRDGRGDRYADTGNRGDKEYAGLALHFVLIRAFRQPVPDEKPPTPYALLGESLGKSEASARKLVNEAERRGMLSGAKPGTGDRYIPEVAQELLFGTLTGRKADRG